MTSVTEIGRQLFNQAFEFKIVAKKERISLKMEACGYDYQVDIDAETLKHEDHIKAAWLNIFKQFERDLDAGVSETTSRIIQL